MNSSKTITGIPGTAVSTRAEPQLKTIIIDANNWSGCYLQWLDAVQASILMPYTDLIYCLVEHFNFPELQRAWHDAHKVYMGIDQTTYSIEQFLSSQPSKADLRKQEDYYKAKLGFDRFTLPHEPVHVRYNKDLRTISDWALLALCHDETICANNRHAYSTFANAVLVMFEKLCKGFSNLFPILNFYQAFITAHKEASNFHFTRQRMINRAMGLEEEDRQQALLGAHMMLTSNSMNAFLSNFTKLITEPGELDIFFMGYQHLFNHRILTNKVPWLLAVEQQSNLGSEERISLNSLASQASMLQQQLGRVRPAH